MALGFMLAQGTLAVLGMGVLIGVTQGNPDAVFPVAFFGLAFCCFVGWIILIHKGKEKEAE